MHTYEKQFFPGVQKSIALAESEPGSCHIASLGSDHLLPNISRLLTLWKQEAAFHFLIPWKWKEGNEFPLFHYSPTIFLHPPTHHCGKYLLEMQPEIYSFKRLLCEWKRNTGIGSIMCGSLKRIQEMKGWKEESFFKIKLSTQTEIHFNKQNT